MTGMGKKRDAGHRIAAELGTKISARDAKSFRGTSLHRNWRGRDGECISFCDSAISFQFGTTRPPQIPPFLLRLCSHRAPIAACQSSKK